MSKIIGIDLGTTNSCVAVMEGDQPKVLTNAQGGRTTPSVVGFTEKGETLIGQVARHQQVTNPENTIYSTKRFMGRRHTEVAQEEKEISYKITGDDVIKITAQSKDYTPPEISAKILQDLRKTAEEYLGHKVDKAVITVPAYFNDAQRKATKDAGVIAGLKVERIVNEPTAAALAYGLNSTKSQKIAVYDLGGGTFDISILDIGDSVFEVLSTNGDTHLGGDDIDEELINFMANELRKKEGIDIRKDPMALQRLKEACEKAKCELSTMMETTINLPFITADQNGPKHLTEKITRSKFEHLINSLVEKSRGPVDMAIKDAKLTASEIDEVMLVGGSTRIPLVQKLVQEIFGKEPNKSINPDEVVALGAAIQGAILSGDKDDIVLLDVTPLSLGVETLGSIMTKLIEKNTTIPTSKKETFTTAQDNQPEVTINVLQGERTMANDNRSLGRFNLTGIAPSPRGLPQIEVTFDIDANGILNVAAKDTGTDKEQSIRIEGSSGLDKSEVEKMRQEAEENAVADEENKKVVMLRNQLDQAIYQSKKSIEEHGDKLQPEDITKIEQATTQAEKAVKGDDAATMETALKDLGEASMKIGQILYEEAQKQAQSDSKPEENPKEHSTTEVPDDIIEGEFTDANEAEASTKEN